MTANLQDIPFDQYSRQKIVADTINKLRKDDEKFKLLDVGGYKGKTEEFLSDDTTILDLFDVKAKNYVQGDGTNLKFNDNSYDFTVSFDVLEHLTNAKRKNFIKEASRVASEGFFLCCPFNNKDGAQAEAEQALNDIYRDLSKQDHPWLIEHIDNKLPTTREIEGILSENKLYFAKLYSNKLENWTSMQMIFFYSDVLKIPSMEAGVINSYYNENLYSFETGCDEQNSYRVIYFITEDKQLAGKTKSIFDKLRQNKPPKQLIQKVPTALTEITKSLQHTNKQLKIENTNNLKHIEELRSNILIMRNSLSWRITKPVRFFSKLIKGQL